VKHQQITQSKIVVIAYFPDPLEPSEQREITERAVALSSRLEVALIQSQFPDVENYEFALLVSNNGLSLKMFGNHAPGPVSVDFTSPAINYRIKNLVRGQAIAKAVGVKPGVNLSVLDATAGFGKDAFLLASLGCHINLVEREVVVHALLEDGIQRAKESGDSGVQAIISRMNLIFDDFEEIAHSISATDIVYLDPMFPKRSKSALVKKDMFVLQKMLFSSIKAPDEDSLLAPALALAEKRVVVKRAKHSAYLAGKKPSFELSGRSSRYDVYITS